MVSDEFEIKALDRARIDRENKRRAELGLPPKPIPFSVMNEEEQERELIKKRSQDKLRAQLGFSRDSPVRFVESDEFEEEDEDTDEEESED